MQTRSKNKAVTSPAVLRAARGSARRSVGAVSRAGGRGGRQGGRGRGRGRGSGTQPSVQLGTAFAAVAGEINPGGAAGGAGDTVVSPGAGRKRREAKHRSPEGPPVPLQPRPGAEGNANQPLDNGGLIASGNRENALQVSDKVPVAEGAGGAVGDGEPERATVLDYNPNTGSGRPGDLRDKVDLPDPGVEPGTKPPGGGGESKDAQRARARSPQDAPLPGEIPIGEGGIKVLCAFNGEPFRGVVTSVRVDAGGDHIYKVMFDDGDAQELNEREYYLGVLTGLRAPEAMARAQDRDFRGSCKRCDQEVARMPDGTASAYCGRYCMHGKGHDKLFNANGEPMCEVGFCPNAGRPLGNKKFDAACCNSHALLLDARGAAAAAEEICVNNLESRLQRMATTNAKAWASKQADPKRVERAELASDYDAMQQSNVCFNNRVCFNGYECGKEKNPMPQLRLPPSEGDTVKDLKQQNEYLQSELLRWNEHERIKDKELERAAQIQKDKDLAVKLAAQEAALRFDLHCHLGVGGRCKYDTGVHGKAWLQATVTGWDDKCILLEFDDKRYGFKDVPWSVALTRVVADKGRDGGHGDHAGITDVNGFTNGGATARGRLDGAVRVATRNGVDHADQRMIASAIAVNGGERDHQQQQAAIALEQRRAHDELAARVRSTLSHGATRGEKQKARADVLNSSINVALADAGQSGGAGAFQIARPQGGLIRSDKQFNNEQRRTVSPVLRHFRGGGQRDHVFQRSFGNEAAHGVVGAVQLKRVYNQIAADELKIFGNPVVAAGKGEPPCPFFVELVTHQAARGAEEKSGVLQGDGTFKQCGVCCFRLIKCESTMRVFFEGAVRCLSDDAEKFKRMAAGCDAVRVEQYTNSVIHLETVMDMLLCWKDDLQAQWRLVMVDGLRETERLKMASTFFKVVNFTLMHWHYTLTHNGCGMFYCHWDKNIEKIATVSHLDRYPTPKRCIDHGESKQTRMLKLMSQADAPNRSGGGGGGGGGGGARSGATASDFNSVMAAAAEYTPKQRRALAAKLGIEPKQNRQHDKRKTHKPKHNGGGGGGGGGGGDDGVKPEKVETRTCYKCHQVGHIAAKCPGGGSPPGGAAGDEPP